jgi:hypothetical protein
MGLSTRLYQSARKTGLTLSVLVGALAFQSCKDQPLAPRPAAPSIASFANGADQGWVRTSFDVDYTQFVPCLGETVRLYGEVPIQLHTVANPAGGFDSHRLFTPITPNSPQFNIQGLSSGKVFTQVYGGPINEVVHSAAGEVYSFREADTFRAADGSALYFTFVFHGTVNANGVPTATQFVFEDVNCG